MTALTYRSSNTGERDSTGTFTVTKPSGTADGDWLIFVAGCTPSGGQTIALPTVDGTLYSHPAGYFKVGYKLASSEGASYTFTSASGSGNRSSKAAVLSYKGGDSSKPPIAGVATAGGASQSVLAQAVQIPTGGAIGLHIGYAHDSGSSGAISSTPPYGMTERVDSSNSNSTVCVQLAVSEEFVLPWFGRDRTATLASAESDQIGLQLILFQEPLDAGAATGAGIETLIELTYYDEVAAAEATLKWSGRGITFTGGEYYEPRLLNAPEVEQRAADAVVFGGVIATTVSAIRIDNRDSALDLIYRDGLALGRVCVIKTIDVSSPALSDVGAGAASAAVTIFSGTVAALTPDGTAMVLRLSDLTEQLNVPLQINEYDGTSGFGGGTENKGQTKPALFGRAYNLLPAQVGTIGGLETFQIHSGFFENILAVYIRGVAQTDVTPAAPGAGQYNRLGTDGGFEVGSAPDGDVTCTAQGDNNVSYVNSHATIIERMLTAYGPQFDSGLIDSTSFGALEDMLQGEIGIYFPIGDRSSTRDAISRLVRSGGLWLSGGRDGTLHLALAQPGPADRLKLTEPDIVDLRPSPLPAILQPPPHEVSTFTERNFHPLANIASSVTGSTRRKLAGPGRTVRSTSTTIAARQQIPKVWDIPDGLWFDDTDGQLRVDQMRAFIELGLCAVEVTTDRYRGTVELGMSVEIESYPRFGLEGGFSGIVSAWREQPAKGRVIMQLIGVPNFVVTTFTWTPTLIGSTGGSATLSTATGTGVKVGPYVLLQGRIVATSVAGLSGNIQIGGLPFAAQAVASGRMKANITSIANVTGHTMDTVHGTFMGSGERVIKLGDNTTADINVSALTNTSAFDFTITYQAAN